MVKSKKPAKAKKKTKAKTGRKDGSVRTTPEAAKKIKEIARRIHNRWKDKCVAAGYHKPSAKLAIDYLLAGSKFDSSFLTEEEKESNNEYIRVLATVNGGE